MGRLTGPFQIEGRVGNLSFYKTANGIVVRSKGGPSKSKIMSDPSFARTRENMAEFKHATQASRLFRNAFSSLARRASDGTFANRVMSLMMKIIKADTTHAHGQRTVGQETLQWLKGFQFNASKPFMDTLPVAHHVSSNRAKGDVVVEIPAFVPAKRISAPEGVTHFRMMMGVAIIDFERNTHVARTAVSPLFPIGKKKQGPIRIGERIKGDRALPLFVVLGIEFVKVLNGEESVLPKELNAMGVVEWMVG